MSDDVIWATKLVVFSILIVLGVVGLYLRLREVKTEKKS